MPNAEPDPLPPFIPMASEAIDSLPVRTRTSVFQLPPRPQFLAKSHLLSSVMSLPSDIVSMTFDLPWDEDTFLSMSHIKGVKTGVFNATRALLDNPIRLSFFLLYLY